MIFTDLLNTSEMTGMLKKKKEGKNVDDLFLKNRDESEEEMKDKETISQ